VSVQDNIDAVRRFYAAGPTDDDPGRDSFAVDDVVWHVPGNNKVSGRYQGHAEVFTSTAALMKPLDVFRMDVAEVMGNDDRVVAVGTFVAARGAQRVSCRGSHVFRFSPDGRIAEVWGFIDDQLGFDALLSGIID
jgi:uncharacterized protein